MNPQPASLAGCRGQTMIPDPDELDLSMDLEREYELLMTTMYERRLIRRCHAAEKELGHLSESFRQKCADAVDLESELKDAEARVRALEDGLRKLYDDSGDEDFDWQDCARAIRIMLAEAFPRAFPDLAEAIARG